MKFSDSFRHRRYDLIRGEHPSLPRVGADIREDRADLERNKVRGKRFNALNAEGVLGGNGGQDRQAIDLKGGKSLEICLDPSPPA